MMKKTVLAIVGVFVLWSALDYVLHGVILMESYKETASLWRPMDQMKLGLMRVVTLTASACFVLIWAWLIRPKSLASGLRFGLLFGLVSGISMGYGSYSYMPIPYFMALAWFLGSLVQGVAAGALTAGIVRED